MSIADKVLQLKQDIGDAYQAGYDKGKAEGGGDSWYDILWDAIQKNGERTSYEAAFGGSQGWTTNSFKPKYDLKPTNARNMFNSAFYYSEAEPVDLTEVLNKAGIVLDTSKATDVFSMFNTAKIKRIPVIDLREAKYGSVGYAIYSVFRGCSVEIIDGLILREDGASVFNLTFTSCNNLKEITFIQGVIGTSIAFDYSPLLNKQTIIRVINALSDATTEKSVIFKRAAINTAFETAEGLADGSTSAEWLALVATKPNWTISLV